MKKSLPILFALLLAGCHSAPQPQRKTMTAQQATTLARDLANAQAATLYRCQPFHNGTPVQFAKGYWIWREHRGVGHLDMEAHVRFRKDGSEPSVDVLLLDSQSAQPLF